MDKKKMASFIPQPPDGLTLREQARWWAQNPKCLHMALLHDIIPPETFAAIFQVGKDNDLSRKIIDRKNVHGLTSEERARIYELLTDGKEWRDQKHEPTISAVDELLLTEAANEITDPEERRHHLHKESKSHGKSGETTKLLKRIDGLLDKFKGYDPQVLSMLLHICQEDGIKAREDDLLLILSIMQLTRNSESTS